MLDVGIESAGAGEFSQRAFMNGKLDLTQAEAVMDLISAQTELAMRAAHEQLQGTLGHESEAIREEILGIAAHVEAYIDFPEEDIDTDTGAALLERLKLVGKSITKLLQTAEQGRILREGVRTVIFGSPNAGMLNVLAATKFRIIFVGQVISQFQRSSTLRCAPVCGSVKCVWF